VAGISRIQFSDTCSNIEGQFNDLSFKKWYVAGMSRIQFPDSNIKGESKDFAFKITFVTESVTVVLNIKF
jgi:hypothetical protein